MSKFKKILRFFCVKMLITSFLSMQSQAYALSFETNPVANKVGLAIRQAVSTVGVSGSSAEMYMALQKSSYALRASATAVSAPTMIAVASSFGVGYLIGTGIYNGLDKAISWYQNPDGTVAVTKIYSAISAPTLLSGGVAWRTSGNFSGQYIVSSETLLPLLYMSQSKNWASFSNCKISVDNYGVSTYACDFISALTNQPSLARGMGTKITNKTTCKSGEIIVVVNNIDKCTVDTNIQIPMVDVPRTTVYPGTQEAIDSLTPDDRAKLVPNQTIVTLANGIIDKVNSDPTYIGPQIPQVTLKNVVDSSVGQPVATIDDLVKPLAPSSASFPADLSPLPPPGALEQPSLGSKTSTTNIDVKVDLGPDPGISKPILEDTPTAAAILNPIFTLLPGFKNISFSNTGASCPKFGFNVLDHDFNFDSFCLLLEENKPTIRAVALASYGLLAVIIVLAA